MSYLDVNMNYIKSLLFLDIYTTMPLPYGRVIIYLSFQLL